MIVCLMLYISCVTVLQKQHFSFLSFPEMCCSSHFCCHSTDNNIDHEPQGKRHEAFKSHEKSRFGVVGCECVNEIKLNFNETNH